MTYIASSTTRDGAPPHDREFATEAAADVERANMLAAGAAHAVVWELGDEVAS